MPKNADKPCDEQQSGIYANNDKILTDYDAMVTMVTIGNTKNAENADKFICEKCDFRCSKYSNYMIHLSTRKHQITTTEITKNAENAAENATENAAENAENAIDYAYAYASSSNTCPNCNKRYLHRSGLARHKKSCVSSQPLITRAEYNNILHLLHELKNKDKPILEVNTEDTGDKQNALMLELIKSNTQLQSQVYEICKSSQLTSINSNSNNTITNCNNPTFNMNMFLNEKCKDAMNMKDFVNSIQLNMTDMENMDRLGYVEGMSTIFINNLKKTDVYKRPVHCSDMKRETLYVKENDQWEREGPDHAKMTKAVLAVEHKNVVLVNEWANANPRCLNSNTRENEKYFRLSTIVTDGDKHGNIAKVIRKVAKRVGIERPRNGAE